jgi:hypothetical protein
MSIDQTTSVRMRSVADLEVLRYTPEEKTLLHLRSIMTLVVMYGSLVFASYHPRFLWAAFLINMFSAVRYSGYIHALNHAYLGAKRVPWLLEVLPAPYSPFILGFSEVQRIHLTHHQYETADGDPDNFVIAGRSKLLIFLKCAFIFEHWFFYAVRHHWLTHRFWVGYACRLALFAGLLLGTDPWTFLIGFVLATKLGTGASFFIFSYLAHVQHGKRGNYLLPLPAPLVVANHVLIGRYAADPAGFHATHHARPSLSCGRLDVAHRAMTVSG